MKTRAGELAYLDFGLVSEIPPSVMDAIICATVHLMNRAYPALASDFPGTITVIQNLMKHVVIVEVSHVQQLLLGLMSVSR